MVFSPSERCYTQVLSVIQAPATAELWLLFRKKGASDDL
jgi:hypothetical protein